LRTQDLEGIRDFYVERVGMKPWLAQDGIEILHHDCFLVGFQRADAVDRDGLLTFVYRSSGEVDRVYERLEKIALAPPKRTEHYQIYNFFATDPDGRRIEFQAFLHELPEKPNLFE
jgi:catechol 2,3-dioxygenase-like lactoylglutathione lyase family enzyme